jgi:formylmethanofuran dehydrogenase subunit E
MDIQPLLEKSSHDHSHLCPRQILGVRMGLLGLEALGFDTPPGKKRMLVITETDGCFVDGITAATNCTVGHRTLRVEDYGKVAAVFADTKTGKTFRIAPSLDVRKRAHHYAPPGETRRYFAQLHGYQVMPLSEMFFTQEVVLRASVNEIVSRPGVRVNCEMCGEEIINEREIQRDGFTLCRACAGEAFYQPNGILVQFTPVNA